MDLLTTYTHDSELQAITAPSLISTLYRSQHAKSSPDCSVFTSCCLVTDLSYGDSSASVLTSLLSGEYYAAEAPSLLSLPCGTQLSTDWVKVTLRLTVSQSVSLGVEPHLGLMTRYLLLLHSYGLVFCGAPSLTRGRVCLLNMLLVLASAVFLGSESLGIRDHILLSQI
jgi:hypothetical protein